MCRLFFSHSQTPFDVSDQLAAFAELSKNNPSPEGDWQGDGWGIAWLDENINWKTHKDTQPIWESHNQVSIPESTQFLVHSRSKSFENDVVSTEYNQPFISDKLAFMFNGSMQGVHIPSPGRIGAEKVFNFLQLFYSKTPNFMQKVRDQLNLTTTRLLASNIILSDQVSVHVLCNHSGEHPDYHDLHYSHSEQSLMVCSQPLPSLNQEWTRITNTEVAHISVTQRNDT